MRIEKLTGLLKDLVAIPSFSRDEGAAADYLEQWLCREGLSPQRVENNLILDSDPLSDKPILLLNAHIDTVRPAAGYTKDPFVAEEVEGRIYGLGTNDDGGSLVALLGAYLRLTEKEQPYRLVWSATAEEEVSGVNGIEKILPLFGKVSLGIVGEPTGMQMAVSERGLIVLDCVSHGVSGHAARKEGVNAISEALDDIMWFNSYRFDRSSQTLGDVTMSVTMISSGTQHNVVPDECKFVVDIRPNGCYSNQEIISIINENVKCDVTPRSLRHNSSSISLDHPVVLRGKSLNLNMFGSPTTSNQTLLDFTTLKIGPGESSRSHQADEYIETREIEQGIDIYTKLLDNLEL